MDAKTSSNSCTKKGEHDMNRYRKWVSPGLPGHCTFSLDKPLDTSPHRHVERQKSANPLRILPSVLHHVRNTPLIRINNIAKAEGIECELLVKCEYLSVGGSVKDRMALRLLEDAEAAGYVKPGDTIIEPSSGNTGVGLAMACNIKGYKCVIVMPARMSGEKVDVIKALGAKIVRSKNGSIDSEDSHMRVAQRLCEQTPDAHVLCQYRNASNPLTHFDETAEEILEACDGKLAMMVATAGTGGTITGLSRKLKMKCPDCMMVGVDALGSMMAQPEAINTDLGLPIEMEGLGHDFIPTTLQRNDIDKWYKSTDKESFVMARRMIREEGLLIGGSCGAALECAIRAIKEAGLKKGDKCVVLLPDSIRNYMSKFLRDDWMTDRGFYDSPTQWWWNKTASELVGKAPATVKELTSVHDTLNEMTSNGLDQVPVLGTSGSLVGVVTVKALTNHVLSGEVSTSDPVSKVMEEHFKKVQVGTPLRKVSALVKSDDFVVVLEDTDGEPKEKVKAVISRVDLLKYVTSSQPNAA